MKVMIHTCKKREYYVSNFLVPALIKSGFEKDEVYIYLDDKGLGCLKSYLKSFEELPANNDNIWHLQDDVLPRRDFFKHSEKLSVFDDAIICGFGNKEFYTKNDFGYANNASEMFYSFPCIRIPNYICNNFVKWFDMVAKKEVKYQKYIVNNKFVDYLFKEFVDYHFLGVNMTIFNYRPCLVEHVDEFVEGSTVNKNRPKPAKALIFNDKVALEELCKWYDNQKTYRHDR